MEENKHLSKNTDKFFEHLQQSNPVMGSDEIKKILDSGTYIKQASHKRFWQTRRFRNGVFIVLALLLFSAVPVFFYHDNEERTHTVNPVPAEAKNNSVPVKEINAGSITENNIIDDKVPFPVTKEKRTATSSKQSKLYNGDVTVTFEDDGMNIKMSFFLGEVSDLEIDGKKIETSEYSDYVSVIEKGKQMAIENNGAKMTEKEKSNQQLMNELIKQLVKDGLVEEGGKFDFRLTGKELLLNDEKQSDELFAKYKKLYEDISGEQLKGNSNVHIQH